MSVRGASINALILAHDNTLWLCGDIGWRWQRIPRDPDQDRLLNAKKKSEEEQRNSGLMNEWEPTVGGTHNPGLSSGIPSTT